MWGEGLTGNIAWDRKGGCLQAPQDFPPGWVEVRVRTAEAGAKPYSVRCEFKEGPLDN